MLSRRLGAGGGGPKRPGGCSPQARPLRSRLIRDSHQTQVQGSLPRRRRHRGLRHVSRVRDVGRARKEAGQEPAPRASATRPLGSMTRRSTPVPLHPYPEHRICECALRHPRGIRDWLCSSAPHPLPKRFLGEAGRAEGFLWSWRLLVLRACVLAPGRSPPPATRALPRLVVLALHPRWNFLRLPFTQSFHRL